MKAITFAAPIPTYLLTMAAGALAPRLRVGRFACTRYGEVPDPALPGERWVRVRTRLGGICGSDLAVVALAASPATSPFSSFPFVLGHENVGVIESLGSAVRGLAVGERVVANPLLACAARGLEPVCDACRVEGKFAGVGGIADEALLRRYIGMGVRLVLPGSDLAFMIAAASERAAVMRACL